MTTDGEADNTGRRSGLSARLRTFLERDILCLWCIAHRSDLAFGDLQANVSEVKHWRAFSVAAPSIWNSLPPSLRLIESHTVFRRQLKTHLFNLAFD